MGIRMLIFLGVNVSTFFTVLTLGMGAPAADLVVIGTTDPIGRHVRGCKEPHHARRPKLFLTLLERRAGGLEAGHGRG